MQHLLDGAGVVPAFDDIKGDALTDLQKGPARLFQGNGLALPDWVDGLAILKLPGGLFLRIHKVFVGNERVSIYRLIPFLGPFFLP